MLGVHVLVTGYHHTTLMTAEKRSTQKAIILLRELWEHLSLVHHLDRCDRSEHKSGPDTGGTQVWTRYWWDTSLDPIQVGHKSGPDTGGTQVWTWYRWDTSLDPIQVGHKSGPDTGGTHAHVIIVLVWLWLMLHNHVVYCYVRFDGWCVPIKGPSIIVNIFTSVQTVH